MTMQPHTVFTALYPGNTFRFCIHPEPATSFPEGRPLEEGIEFQRSSVHKDAEGRLSSGKKNNKFIFDPPMGHFKFSNNQGELLSGTIHTGQFNPAHLFVRIRSDDVVLGFGAATGQAERSNQSFQLMNQDTLFYSIKESAYASFPFFILKRKNTCVGFFLNQLIPARVVVDSSESTHSGPGIHFNFDQTRPMAIDSFVFQGSLAEILDSYTAITGRPAHPPLWSLGFHQSRWSYKSQSRVLDLADRFHKEDIPVDAIHLDIHHMEKYRVFTWDARRFPDPPGMHKSLAEKGIRTVAIVDPGVAAVPGYPVYDSGLEQDVYCKTSEGEVYYGRVWPGTTAMPDFTMSGTRDWWSENHKPLFEAGVSGIWNDMNEPVLKMGKARDPLQEDVLHQSGKHYETRNLYANLEAEATVQAFGQYRPGKRPFILSRSGFCGIQKHSFLWTGDNHSTWAHLKENLHMVLNLGLSGSPFSGADVGGFAAGANLVTGAIKLRRNKELFARWIQLGSLMPFFRAHTVLFSRDQEPWSFGEEVLRISRKHIKRRYRLLPYIYRLFQEACISGAPPVRPLYYEYPELDFEKCKEQFMLGPSLLAAPVLNAKQKKKEVYLPPGAWYEYETGKLFQGDATCTLDTPLGYYPLFVRAGTILPVCRAAHNSLSSFYADTALEIYPAQTMAGELYLDDGESLASLTQENFQVRLQAKRDRSDNITLHMSGDNLQENPAYKPPIKEITVRLPAVYSRMKLGEKKVESRVVDLIWEDRSISMSTFTLPLATKRADFFKKG